MNKRDRLILLGADIQSFRNQIQELKDKLRVAEAEFDRVMLTSDGDAEFRQNGIAASRASRGQSTLAEKLRGILDATPGRAFSAEDLVAELGDGANIASVRSTLARETDARMIAKPARGMYQSAKGGAHSGTGIIHPDFDATGSEDAQQ